MKLGIAHIQNGIHFSTVTITLLAFVKTRAAFGEITLEYIQDIVGSNDT